MLSAATLVMAQGNLQFNQAILMTNAQSIIVPTDKVWKIESMTVGDGYSGGDNVRFFITLNGVENHLVYVSRSPSWGDRTNTAKALPLWIPAGVTVAVPSYGNNDTTTRIRTISILEFNIVE